MIKKIYDNSGNLRNVYFLPLGSKLKAKKLVTSTGDIGASGRTYKYSAFEPDKIYKVVHNVNWRGTNISYVIDSDATLHFAEIELFDLE